MEAIDVNDSKNHKIKEATVISRILNGEKELYEILVRRNNQKLFRVIRSYLKDDAEVEDAMQNSYLKAYDKLHQFKMESSFSTWLVRIGINEALARLKEKGKVYRINEHSDTPYRNTILEIPDDKQLNPQEKMIRFEAKQLLESAIDQLDVKYKTVYIMKELEDMSFKEISTALGITAANAKVRLHRSKEMLKDKLYDLSNPKDVFEFGFDRCDKITENVMNSI